MRPALTVSRMGALFGATAIVANVAAVVVVSTGISSVYRPEAIARWRHEVLEHPGLNDASSALFFIGCFALLPFARELARAFEERRATLAAWLIAAAALLNVVGTPLPPLAVRLLGECTSAECEGRFDLLLRAALALDAGFNALLGAGLVVLGLALRSRFPKRALLSVVAGALTVPVGFQVVSSAAADFLGIAGPLWLLSLVLWSVTLWRGR